MGSDEKPHRWRELIYRAVESDTLDYKSPLNWNTLPRSGKAKFVRHCLALANTKGGHVVVGVSEDEAGRPVVYTGLTPEESKSFDPSNVGPFINRCVEPPIDFTIERPVIDGKRYAIFVVKPFSQQPHVCALGIADELQTGVFYIRTTDASSRPAYRATEIHALIQRAMRRQRELLSRLLRGLLFENRQNPELDSINRFDEETLHSRSFFRRRAAAAAPADYFLEITAHPAQYRSDFFTRPELENALHQLPEFAETSEWYGANTSWRRLDETAGNLRQFYRSGLYYQLDLVKKLDTAELRRRIIAGVDQLCRLYSAAGLMDEALGVEIRLHRSDWSDGKLRLRSRNGDIEADSGELYDSGWYGAIAWSSAPAEHAIELFDRLTEKFASVS